MAANNSNIVPKGALRTLTKQEAEEVSLHISNRRIRARKIFYALAQIIFSMDVLPMDADMIKDSGISTAYTDGLQIRYNPAFMATMPTNDDIFKDGIMFVLMHEVMHKILFHCSGIRTNRKYRNMKVFNLACDYADNAILAELGITIPKGEGFLFRQDFANLSTEEIYRILMNEFTEMAQKVKQNQSQQGQQSGGGGMTIELPDDGSGGQGQSQEKDEQGQGQNGGVIDASSQPKRRIGRPKKDQTQNEKSDGKQGQGQGQGQGNNANGNMSDAIDNVIPSNMKSFDDHSHWGDRIPKDEEKAKEEERKERAMVNATLGRLANELKDRYQGKIPDFLKRIMSEGTKSEYSFADAINQYVVSCIAPQETTMNKPNYNLLSFAYLPGMQKRYLDMSIAVDTSGSIGNDELKKFYDAISTTLKEFVSWHVDLMFCDAAVHKRLSIENEEDLLHAFTKEIGGGGGTDFRPVFNAFETNPAILVYLTDGYGTFPEKEPEFPVIWVSLTDETSVKYPDWPNSMVIPLEKLKGE